MPEDTADNGTTQRHAAAELPLLSEQFGETIRQGVEEALAEHAVAGRAVAIAKDGEVIWVAAEELLHKQRSHTTGC